MSASHLVGNRNSTPEASNSSLRPPSSRAIGSGHHLRASADMSAFSSSPLSSRGIRPSSEVYFNHGQSQAQNSADDAMDRAAQQWIADIDQYETTLEEMAAATLDQDFKDELSAIEQWFRVLSEAERTAALYALLQQTTQVQIRFFIQVLQQMAKSHPMSGVLSPANFGEKDPMSNRLSDAMSKLNVEPSRNSLGRPPPSPGNKRNSGLDPSTINAMFPDAAAAIAKKKAEFTQQTGNTPGSNRNSAAFGDRSSLVAPTISAPGDGKDNLPQPPSSPWGPRNNENQQPIARPKSSSEQQPPMGQFTQPPPSAGLRSPRPSAVSGNTNMQTTTLNAPDHHNDLPILSPYNPGNASWASLTNTPMVANFGQSGVNQADMVANATAMKLAAMSTVNNRIALDDVRKYRRNRSAEGQGSMGAQQPLSPGLPVSNLQAANLPGANIVMVNEHGQVLSREQVAALQAQQQAAMAGRRSRPSSPGLAMQGAGLGGLNFTSPQNNGFLSAYDGSGPLLNNGMTGLNLSQYGMGHNEGYLSDHSEIARGRSPRGRRGSSKPPEDPTDPTLLQDIPNWLRSLRLHKYTDNLKDLKWTDLVELDDEGLEKRGVNALGARRKMLKVFEQVKEAKSEGKL
ncbi:MAG: Flap-structured DNA-binding and RNA-binding protein [Sarea resinae]|nr:MAG: Flap-structured DNA-binding and RNA-binding protein [Sarea resinae]